MNKAIFYAVIGLISLPGCSGVYSQEVPEIWHFGEEEWISKEQVWMIAEDCDGYIYAANSSGIQIFNGFNWTLKRLPKNAMVRSVYAGVDCRVYVGGYQTFGYLDLSDRSEPCYVPLSDSTFANSEQEIWNIYGNEKGIVFQSFSRVWYYDFVHLTSYIPPTNIMLGNQVQGRFYIPQIGAGIYLFQEGKFQLLDLHNSLPPESRIAAISNSGSENELIVATQKDGLYRLNENRLIPVDQPLNDKLKLEQINRFLNYSKEKYVIGTILNGVYITDREFNILYHISRSDGLSNNTVLSLFEDSQGNLLVGLDKGMNLIKLNKNTLHYYDSQDAIGVIFDAIIYEGVLHIASNKGVFKKAELGEFKLVEGSQGQAWSFLNVDGDLLCGHNSGTFKIGGNGEFTQICHITGGWDMTRVGENLILQSTYTGLILLEKSVGNWNLKKRIEQGDILIKDFVIKDSLLVGLHPHFGIHIVHFSPHFSKVLNAQHLTDNRHMEWGPAVSLSMIDNAIRIILPDAIYQYEEGTFHRIDARDWTIKDSTGFCELLARQNILSSSLPSNDRELHYLDNGSTVNYLIGSADGYYLSDLHSLCLESTELRVDIQYVKIKDSEFSISPPGRLELNPNENQLVVQLRKNLPFVNQDNLSYQLTNWSDEWLSIPDNGLLEFRNLNDGEYSLRISQAGNTFEEILSFQIKPRWYESWIGFLLYLLVISGLVYVSNWISKRKLLRKTQKLLKEREKEIEAERLRHKNEKLEKELVYKSKTLANDAMVLIQKNNMLNQMKTVLSRRSQNEINRELKARLLRLINKNINNDEYWQIFELNFNEVHENFLKRLKRKHPQLTPGERRLAAYIRMDLQSKEIAPLLNISTRSVENKRYRLRKRMDLDHDQNLKEYILRF